MLLFGKGVCAPSNKAHRPDSREQQKSSVAFLRGSGISGESGQAMDCISPRHSQAKVPTARPDKPDMLPKRTKRGMVK